MQSDIVYEQAKATATGIAQPTVGLGVLRNFALPVPPLDEQERIVAKIDHLMALCDELEAKLRRAEDRAAKFAEAVVAEILAGPVSDPARRALEEGWAQPLAPATISAELLEWGLGAGETAVLAVARARPAPRSLTTLWRAPAPKPLACP